MKWSVELEKVIERVAINEGVSVAEAKQIVEHVLLNTKKSLQLPTMPKVLLHGFGTFRVKPSRLAHKIANLDKRLKKGSITEEEYEETKKRYISIYERLTGEKTDEKS